jgi:hypothetical protein
VHKPFKLSVISHYPSSKFVYGIGYGWDPMNTCTLFWHNQYHPTIPSYERGSNDSFVCMMTGLDPRSLGAIKPYTYQSLADFDPYLEQKSLCPRRVRAPDRFTIPSAHQSKNIISLNNKERVPVPQLDYPTELSPGNLTLFHGIETIEMNADALESLRGGHYLSDEMMLLLTLG